MRQDLYIDGKKSLILLQRSIYDWMFTPNIFILSFIYIIWYDLIEGFTDFKHTFLMNHFDLLNHWTWKIFNCQQLFVFLPRIAIMTVCRKSFTTSSLRNPPRFLFLGRAWCQMGQKDQYLAKMTKNTTLGPKLAVFGPILAKLLL